jgi:superfamily I DNA and/or RNA helicase
MTIINLKVLIKSLSKVVHADSSWLSSVRQDIGYKCRVLYIGIVLYYRMVESLPIMLGALPREH